MVILKRRLSDACLSTNDVRYLDYAIQAARRSQHRTKVGAVVVKSGKVLAVRPNKSTNNPCNAPQPHCSVHAEVAALRCCGRPAGATLYVARVGARLEPRLAAPCTNCMVFITKAQVKKIVWTTNEGYGTLRL